jgi:hypothetical protein
MARKQKPGTFWTLNFFAEDGPVPSSCRVRALIKRMLRAYSLRLTSIVEHRDGQPDREIADADDRTIGEAVPGSLQTLQDDPRPGAAGPARSGAK